MSRPAFPFLVQVHALIYNCETGFSWIGHLEVAWRFPLAFQIVFAVVIFCSILNLPESPRWLVMQGRDDDALEILECLNEKKRDDPYIQTEFEAIKKTVEEMSKGSYRSLFDMSEYREFHRVALAYVIQMYQQISGINLITYYVSYPITYSAKQGLSFVTNGVGLLGTFPLLTDWPYRKQSPKAVGCV